jgi:hypothetical protein
LPGLNPTYGVIEWNGSSWSNVNYPLPADQVTALDCQNTHWCMAMAAPGQCIGCGGQPESVLWNGSSWTTSDVGTQTVPGTTEFGMSCSSTSQCMTTSDVDGPIMGSGTAATQQNVSYEWDGSAWNPVPWPDDEVSVASLSCPSMNLCYQVASPNDGTPGSGEGDVTFTWRGSGWTEDSTPLPGGLGTESLSCTSATFCMALGDPVSGGTTSPNGADVWNGYDWTATTFPSTGDDSFAAVSCVARYCLAAGYLSAVWNVVG